MMIFSDKKIIKKFQYLSVELFKKHPTWLLCLLIFILTIYLFVLFGFYALKDPPKQPAQSNIKMKTELYQSVVDRLKNRETKIQEAKEASYPDIFK